MFSITTIRSSSSSCDCIHLAVKMPPRLKAQSWRQIQSSFHSRRCTVRQFGGVSRSIALRSTEQRPKSSTSSTCRLTRPYNLSWTQKGLSSSTRQQIPDTEISRSSDASILASVQQTLPSIDPKISVPAESLPDPKNLGPLRAEDTFSRRYPAIVEQFVGLIMRHGKKAQAQRVRCSHLVSCNC
jgi:hypothetical protein